MLEDRFQYLRQQAKFFRPDFKRIEHWTMTMLGRSTSSRIKKGSKDPKDVEARRIMFIVSREFGYSYPEIATGLRTGHDTVIKACANYSGCPDYQAIVPLIVGKILLDHRELLDYRRRVEIAMEFLGVSGQGAFSLYNHILEAANGN